MADYARAAAKAKAAIENNGRQITVVKYGNTVDTPTKAWRGSENVRSTPEASVITYGVFVDIAGLKSLGFSTADDEILKQSEKFVILAPGDFAGKDAETFNELIDGSVRWTITVVRRLEPGDTVVLYYMGLKR